VGCLYCGKDIGPFRVLRDDEFCSSAHRKRYGERLGKALDRIGAPELIPSRTPGALERWPVQEWQSRQTEGVWDFGHPEHPVEIGELWPLTVTPTLGSGSKPMGVPVLNPPPADWSNCLRPLSITLSLPHFDRSLEAGLPFVVSALSGRPQAGMAPRESRPKARIIPLPVRGGSQVKPRLAGAICLPAFDGSLRTGLTTVQAAVTADLQEGFTPPESQLTAEVLPRPSLDGITARQQTVEPLPIRDEIAAKPQTVAPPYRPILRRFEHRMPSPAAEPVARLVLPLTATALNRGISAVLPSLAGSAIRRPQVPPTASWQCPPPAEPVALMVWSRCSLEPVELVRAESTAVRLPSLERFSPLREVIAVLGQVNGPSSPIEAVEPPVASHYPAVHLSGCPAMAGPQPVPVESPFASALSLIPLASAPETHALRLPSLAPISDLPVSMGRLRTWPSPVPALIPSLAAISPADVGQVGDVPLSASSLAPCPTWPSPVQSFIPPPSEPVAIAMATDALRLPGLELIADLAASLSTTKMCPAWPSPVPSLIPAAASPSPATVGPDGLEIQLPYVGPVTGEPFSASTSKTRPAWPTPDEAIIPPVSVPEPIAASADALLPDMEQVAGLPYSIGASRTLAESHFACPTWPSPVQSLLPAVAEPMPIAMVTSAFRLPGVELVAKPALSLDSAASFAAWMRPAELPIPASSAANPTLLSWDVPATQLPRLTLAGELPPSLGMSGTCIAWSEVAASPNPAQYAPEPIDVMPDVPVLQVPSLDPIAELTPSLGLSKACTSWPAAVQSLIPLATAPDVPATGTQVVPRLPSVGRLFDLPSLLNRLGIPAVARDRNLSGYPALTVAARPGRSLSSFVPAPVAIEPAAIVLSLPMAGKPGADPAAVRVGPTPGLAPSPVESLPAIAAFAPFRIGRTPELRFPQVPSPQSTGLSEAGLDGFYPAYIAPKPQELNTNAAVLTPIASLKLSQFAVPTGRSAAAIPQPGFIPVEFYCQRGVVSPCQRLAWNSRPMPPLLPEFTMRVVVDRTDDIATWKPAPKTPANRDIPSISEAARRRSREVAIGRFLKVAACLVMGVFLWFGARELKVGGPPAIQNSTASAVPVAIPGGFLPAGPAPAAGQSKGVMAGVRQAIANRAASSMTDTLQADMHSWGVPAKSWAPGWSRNPDGYVHPGEMALFHPSLGYKDYRLEFFGQIENKSMDWAVRAQDKQNYYAMKFTVLQAGLRPVIAMAHYPVVGGRKGHRVEVPLSVMVHNNTPIHVAVDVQGNRVTASVEGQQVDSWTDDLLPSGGVGFFSEAGEKARLYWMKVSKNQDWLGAICSYLSDSNGNTRNTADLWAPGIPDGPAPAAPAQPQDVALAEAETRTNDFSGPQRARIWIQRRI
jgi:hypothetical protein